MNAQPPGPTVDLLLAPAARGKTAAVVRRLAEPREGIALALVPGAVQQRGLLDRLGRAASVRVVPFYSLAGIVLRRAGAVPAPLGDTARIGLVRALLRELRDEGRLPTYAAVAGKPGFVAAVAELIADLGDADIAPGAFAAAARSPHDSELAEVYRRYVVFQERRGLADLPRRLRLARDALLARPGLLDDVALLVVDGFDQFSPLQLSLLAALARRVPHTLITLTLDRRDRPAHRRFARTYAGMRAALDIRTIRLEPGPRGGAAPLRHVEAHLFDLDEEAPRVPAGGIVTVIEAADREREVRAVLRQIRRLIDRGTPPREVAVLFRDGAPYTPLLREVAAEYRLPLDIHEGLPLDQAPPIATLLGLLRLPLDDYPRRALVETLRSPYLPWSASLPFLSSPSPVFGPRSMAGLLDAVARHCAVAGGLARWRAALDRLAAEEPSAGAGADDQQPPVSAVEAAALREALDQLHAWMTPPERATVAGYAAWARERLGVLQGPSAALPDTVSDASGQLPPTLGGADGEDDDSRLAARDTAAIRRFDRLLHDLAHAAALLDTPDVTFRAFLDDLAGAAASSRYRLRVHGGIAAMPALVARGLAFEHVAILGLSEGEFPRPPREPALYSRSERRALLDERGLDLPAPDPADERTIFYEAVARARGSLTLARPRLDESGNPLPRSPYLAALLGLVNGVEPAVIPAGSVPDWDEAASPQERALALAEALSRPLTPDPRPPTSLLALVSAVRGEYPVWDHVVRARAVEAEREGLGDYGPFEGAIDDATLVVEVAGRFGPPHRWSVTEFDDYITCPFRFAAAHVLRLAPRADPADTLDGAQRGQLYHAIMARAGERWRLAERALAPENEATALETLDAAAQEVLDDAPERFGFSPSAFWDWERAEIRRRLRAALRGFIRAAAQGDWQAFEPAGVEQRFGGRRGNPPLRVETLAGPVLIQGRIDRVDQRADGALAVVDYKSGGARAARDAPEGRDLQLPIYVLAVEQVLAPGQQVERAAFFHIGSGKRSAELKGADLRQALEVARERIAETISAVQAADFRVYPREGCPPFCEFETICRRNLDKRRLR